MKHHKPIRSILLLAILSCAGLLGCQWDSATYDSYVTAFGEWGPDKFDDCKDMEYILVKTSGSNEQATKLHRSICCNSSSSTNDPNECIPSPDIFKRYPLCIAFQFGKCPNGASRCMVETILTTNTDGTDTEEDHTYCAETICPEHAIGCYIKYQKENSTDDAENIETSDIRTKFICIDPSSDNRCNATCPTSVINIPADTSFTDALTLYYQNLDNLNQATNTLPHNFICSAGKHCLPIAQSKNTDNTNQYECRCDDDTVLCNGECINPNTDIRYCGAKDNCLNDNKGKHCSEGFNCIDQTCVCNVSSGFKTCEGTNSDRMEETCIPASPDKDDIALWNAIGIDDSGCTCLPNYSNHDKKDSNGCELAQTETECGIVGLNAINCLDVFNANEASCTIAYKSENGISKPYGVCNIQENGCKIGFNYINKENDNIKYLMSEKFIKQKQLSENDLNDYIDKLGQKGCRKADNSCCEIEADTGKCKACTDDKVCKGTDNQFKCENNNCESGTYPCPHGCFSKEILDHLNMNEDCTCKPNHVVDILGCRPIIDIVESCGNDQVNCKEKIVINSNKDSGNISCVKSENNDYKCDITCNLNKCNWDNNLSNGCEANLPKEFEDCNKCKEDNTNTIMSIPKNNIKICIKKGQFWGEIRNGNKYPDWNYENVKTYCSNCSSGQYCRYSFREQGGKCCNNNCS